MKLALLAFALLTSNSSLSGQNYQDEAYQDEVYSDYPLQASPSVYLQDEADIPEDAQYGYEQQPLKSYYDNNDEGYSASPQQQSYSRKDFPDSMMEEIPLMRSESIDPSTIPEYDPDSFPTAAFAQPNSNDESTALHPTFLSLPDSLLPVSEDPQNTRLKLINAVDSDQPYNKASKGISQSDFISLEWNDSNEGPAQAFDKEKFNEFSSPSSKIAEKSAEREADNLKIISDEIKNRSSSQVQKTISPLNQIGKRLSQENSDIAEQTIEAKLDTRPENGLITQAGVPPQPGTNALPPSGEIRTIAPGNVNTAQPQPVPIPEQPIAQNPIEPVEPPPRTILINFNNVSIIEYIRFISRITGKNFIFDENDLQFNVTIISEEPATFDNILTALIQELNIHGLSLIEQGDSFVIHRNPDILAINKVVSGNLPETTPGNAQLITQVYRLNTIDADKIGNILRNMISKKAIVQVLKENNQVIVTDLASNIAQITLLLKSLDSPSSGLVVGQYVVKNAFIDALVVLAQKIMQPIALDQPLTFVPHNAANSIFVVSTPFLVERAISILQHLDQNQGTTRIFDLEELKYEQPKGLQQRLPQGGGRGLGNVPGVAPGAAPGAPGAPGGLPEGIQEQPQIPSGRAFWERDAEGNWILSSATNPCCPYSRIPRCWRASWCSRSTWLRSRRSRFPNSSRYPWIPRNSRRSRRHSSTCASRFFCCFQRCSYSSRPARIYSFGRRSSNRCTAPNRKMGFRQPGRLDLPARPRPSWRRSQNLRSCAASHASRGYCQRSRRIVDKRSEWKLVFPISSWEIDNTRGAQA